MERVDASHWVVVIAATDVDLAARLRPMRGVQVLATDDRVWLRAALPTSNAGGHFAGDDLEQRLLRLLPGFRPFLLAADGQLTRVGERVPSAQMPAGKWQPLSTWLQIELPRATANFPGSLSQVALSLVRTTEERESTLLLTSLSAWSDYAETAPQWRLERLVFTVDSSGRVLIRGTPLPPLPGERWVDRNGISTQAGWHWKPPVDVAVLHQIFATQPGDLVLLETSQWQVVHAADWVRATRSAVRSTAEARP